MYLIGFKSVSTKKFLFVSYFVTLIISLFSLSFCENCRGYDVNLKFTTANHLKSGQNIFCRNDQICRLVRTALQFSRQLTLHFRNFEEYFRYIDESFRTCTAGITDNCPNMRFKITTTLTFHDVCPHIDAPDKCSISRSGRGNNWHCQFSAFLQPRETEIELNHLYTKVVSFSYYANECHIPDVFVMDCRAVESEMQLISVGNGVSFTNCGEDYREFFIICGIGNIHEIVSHIHVIAKLRTPPHLNFLISASVTTDELDTAEADEQLSCKRKYNITVMIQPTDQTKTKKDDAVQPGYIIKTEKTTETN